MAVLKMPVPLPTVTFVTPVPPTATIPPATPTRTPPAAAKGPVPTVTAAANQPKLDILNAGPLDDAAGFTGLYYGGEIVNRSGNSVSFVKLTVTENAIQAVQRVAELCGNAALSRNNPLERHLRDVLCARIHWPQGDAVRVAAGRAALGV